MFWQGKDCWYHSITLNKPLMPVWKTFHKLFLGSSSRLICCIPSITRANPNPLWSFRDPRNHDPLKILTVLLMRISDTKLCRIRWELELERTKLKVCSKWESLGSAHCPRLTSELKCSSMKVMKIDLQFFLQTAWMGWWNSILKSNLTYFLRCEKGQIKNPQGT